MRKPDHFDDLGARHANAFIDLFCDAFAIVGMNEIDDPLADQAFLGRAERLANGGTLIGDDTVAIEDGENVACVFDELFAFI